MLFACGAEEGSKADSSTGGARTTGGNSATGGASASGGSGGTSNTGGSTTGGATATGGSPGSGGFFGSGGSTGVGGVGWEERTSVRMFLSGHSLTDNPLPEFIGDLAEQKSNSFNYNQQIGLGSPIRQRTKGAGHEVPGWEGYSTGRNRGGTEGLNVIEELKDPQTLGEGELYDTLVITERHDILGTIEWEHTVGYIHHFHDRLIDGNPSGRTFLYHSWLDINKSNPSVWLDHERKALFAWECAASKVNLLLADAGRADRVTTLPAGGALVDLVQKALADQVAQITGSTEAKLNLIFNDNVHMTRLGAYYMALVTYSAIFGDSPVGASVPSDVDPSAGVAMQQIAWDYVSAYYDRESPGEHSMEECRNIIQQDVCVSFWNLIEDNTGMDRATQITQCQNSFGNPEASAFRWPDDRYPFPAP